MYCEADAESSELVLNGGKENGKSKFLNVYISLLCIIPHVVDTVYEISQLGHNEVKIGLQLLG